MGSFVRAVLNSPSCVRHHRQIIFAILLLASGFIVATAQTRIVTTVAGLTHSVSGNGGPASQATVSYTQGMALDAKGNLYFVDSTNAQIRKIDASTGVITAVAGTGQIGFSGDGQLAVNAQLNSPEDVAVDAAGNIYIADTWNQIIRKVSAATGIITTIAGTPEGASLSGPQGDGGPAIKAYLSYPSGVAVDSSGNVFIADSNDQVVREVNASTGIITTVAGKGLQGYPGTGNGGPATSAMLIDPVGIAFDAGGNLYIYENCDVRKVTAATGIINAYTGNYGSCGYSGDGGPATSAELSSPSHITLDSAGNLYIADYYNNAIRKVTASTGIITTVAGNGSFGFSGDGGSATYAALNNPKGVAVGGDGSIYISDAANYRIREIAASGVISTIAGNGTTGPISNGQGTSTPLGVYGYRWYDSFVADASGNLYFPDTLNNVIRKLTPGGVISTIVGTGVAGYSGDGGPATSAELNNPAGVTFDAQGNLYIADTENGVVRKVDASTGSIGTYAGTYTQYSKAVYSVPSGDGGPATSAVLVAPTGLAVDSSGNLYIAAWQSCVVRKVTPAGIISTYAGQVWVSPSSNNCSFTAAGDGGPATSANLSSFAASLALDSQGNLYIGDVNAVREVSAATGIINTVVGTATIPYGNPDTGDGGAASSANLSQIYGLAIDPSGNIYIADDYAIRVVNTKGIISTAAGLGNGWGYTGDGGLATSAYISPEGVAADASGNIYFIDSYGNRIRKVSTGSVQAAAATPEFSPGPGQFSSNPTVTITTTTPGAQIFYTLDGSTPNPGWDAALYTGPISLVAPVTLTAFTVAPGYSTSATASGNYSTATGAPPPAPAVTLSPAALTFSSQAVGSTSGAQTVALTNTGNAVLNLTSITASGDFSETNTCGTSVAAGSSCTISVTFAPTTGGALTGTITITDNANNSPQTIALSGSGSNVAVSTTSTGMTASAGGSATASLQVSSAGSFSGTVNLTCSVGYQGSGTPQNPPTCSLNPAQEQIASGSSATTTLTVNTTAASSARLSIPWLPFGGGALAALCLFIGVPRRRWYKLGLLIALALITAGATFGCGAGNSTTSTSGGGGGPTNPGTTSGSYVVTVTATSTTDSAQTVSVTIPLSVQ